MPAVYADNSATTIPLDLNVVAQAPGCWANPSSTHYLGRLSKSYLEKARERIARCLGVSNPHEITFTASGTESTNMVLLGGNWDILVSSALEHDATRQTLLLGASRPQVVILKNDQFGRLLVPELQDLPQIQGEKGRVLLSLIWAHNEIGTIQDMQTIQAIRDRLRQWSGGACHVHLDAVQTPGHLPLNLGTQIADFVSLSAHKFHGPRGVGILYSREPLEPRMRGGGQERGQRPGTENVEGIVRAMHALEFVQGEGLAQRCAYMRQLRDIVLKGLEPFCRADVVRISGHPTDRLCHHLSFCVHGTKKKELLDMLDRMGICVSGSSACSSMQNMPSHVLRAIGMPTSYSSGSLRITFSVFNTVQDACYIRDCLVGILGKIPRPQ